MSYRRDIEGKDKFESRINSKISGQPRYFLPLSIMEQEHTHSHSDHSHSHHGHSHGHVVELKSVNTAFIIGIALNLGFVVIEVIAGLIIHSLSLLSDAGHNLADVASLGLALFAFRMLKVKSNATYTYGYKKTTVLVALLNGAILLVSIGAILFESVQRLIDPRSRWNSGSCRQHFVRCQRACGPCPCPQA